MNLLSVENISKSYGELVLFEQLSFGVNKDQKIALIAKNGSGKTAILNILSGLDQPDQGMVNYRKDIKVSFLAQEPILAENSTIEQCILASDNEVLKVIANYEKALLDMDNADGYQKAFDAMDRHAAWDFETQYQQILSKLKLDDLQLKVSALSGGQKKRVALANALLNKPDLLILDEPTNHLDLEMIEWLEVYFAIENITLFMVTHDRYFLERVCNEIVELDQGQLYTYKGNYAYYLEKKAEMEAANASEIGKAQQLMNKELEWMRRSPKARTTKSKSRISAYYETEAKAKSGKKTQDLELAVKMTRIGGKILELKKVYKSYGDNVILKGLDYTFKKGERIGIVGKNGCGKSTFLNMVMDLEQPDSGKINRGDTIVFGYYSQDGMKHLKPEKRVIDVLKDVAEVITLANGATVTASQMLNLFLFPPQMQHQFVEKLSGGEKRRLYLLTVLMLNPNFLILDEPTNDLDILTLNKLEDFLADFGGCILLVSHDRYFLDRIVEHIFVFEGQGEIKYYNGSYTEYRLEQEEQAKQDKKDAKAAPLVLEKAKTEAPKLKLSFKEKYELETLEKELEDLETEKEQLESQLANNPSDFDIIAKASERLGTILQEITIKSDRWLILSEYES